MSVWKAGLVAAIAIVVVGACTKGAGEKAPTEAKVAPVEAPKRKPGLWKQTMLIEGLDAIQTTKLCLDAATDAKLAWWGQQGFKQSCSKSEVKREPDGSWHFSSVCEGGGVKTTNDGTAVGDFNSRYQLKAESSTSGAPVPEMNGSRTVIIDAEWVGECPTGMRAGDIELPNGQRVNIVEISGIQ